MTAPHQRLGVSSGGEMKGYGLSEHAFGSIKECEIEFARNRSEDLHLLKRMNANESI